MAKKDINEAVKKPILDNEIKDIVKSSISILEKKNKKLILLFNNLIEQSNGISDENKCLFLSGMYLAILDYSRKLNSTVLATIAKDDEFVAESLKDYKNSNKPVIWKVGYAIILYEVANKASRRIRLYLRMFMSSKADRKTAINNQWQLSLDELHFFEFFEDRILTEAPEIEQLLEVIQQLNNQRLNNNHNRLNNNQPIEDFNTIDEREVVMDFEHPRYYYEVLWPWNYTKNPSNVEELNELIKVSGYKDTDLDDLSNAIFTTDKQYAIGLATKADDAYLFLLKKDEHNWLPLMLIGKKKEQILLLKYNFNRTFTEHFLWLLDQANLDITKLRLKK